ncbi:hypothetical protein KAR91_77865 [Candidatus Pacearchaeota archaeon]|nr:hypothetical protein [Candidatus Pacearchaeota archaeon]
MAEKNNQMTPQERLRQLQLREKEDLGAEPTGILRSIDVSLKELLGLELERDSIQNIPLIFPDDGGYKLLSEGETLIDFFDGNATLPDRTKETLSNDLSRLKLPHVRSILFFADRRVDLKWDGNAVYTVLPGVPVRLTNVKIKNLHITTDGDTNIRVLASTHPDGVPQLIGDLGGDSITRVNEVAGLTSQEYETVLTYTVTANRTFGLSEISFNEGSSPRQFAKLQWRLTIAGAEQFADKATSTLFSLPFRKAFLAGGEIILVEAKSTDGTSINPEVTLTGKEF